MIAALVSVRLTDNERRILEQRADQEARPVSNYVRKQLRNVLSKEGA